MNSPLRHRMVVLLTFLATTVAAGCLVRADDAPEKSKSSQSSQEKVTTFTVTADQDGEAKYGGQQVTVHVQAVRPGKYWVGIVCSPIESDLVKQQLGIDGGLVVDQVMPDSPAQAGGLQKYDIIVKVGDKPLHDLKELVAAIDQTKGKPFALTVYRQAKREEIKVTPTKRPVTTIRVNADKETAAEWKALAETLQKYGVDVGKQGQATGDPETKRFWFVMPGVVVPEGTRPIPGNLEVTITKKGDQPAQIVVKQGKQQWEVDEKTLDKLPEAIRPHVRRMLGHQQAGTWRGGVLPVQPRTLEKLKPETFRPYLQLRPRVQLAPEATKQLREQVGKNMGQLKEQLDAMAPNATAESLKSIQRDLQQLREQLEKLQADEQGTKDGHPQQHKTTPTKKSPKPQENK